MAWVVLFSGDFQDTNIRICYSHIRPIRRISGEKQDMRVRVKQIMVVVVVARDCATDNYSEEKGDEDLRPFYIGSRLVGFSLPSLFQF